MILQAKVPERAVRHAAHGVPVHGIAGVEADGEVIDGLAAALGIASRYARIATFAVLRADPGAAALAFTLVGFWIDGGRAAPALRLLDHLDALDGIPASEQFAASVLRVRAATAAGATVTAKRALADALLLAKARTSPPADAGVLANALLQLAECATLLGEASAVRQAGRAALLHTPREEYPRIKAELQRIAGKPLDASPLEGAA